ncbi:MAG: ABC transporter substrate-binding protein [bacterium]|nr:ABC transporter substrate-binding protein [bacterium]
MHSRMLWMLAFAASVLPLGAQALAASYIEAKPLAEVIKTPAQACPSSSTIMLPTIAWGADIATSLANGNAKRTAPGSIFAERKLDVTLYRQDDFREQVRDYQACKTAFLRGTIGMLAQAAEVLARDPRTAPVIVYQLSWSNGGDALVVKDGIKTAADLRGKTIALQAYGPHVDYLLTVLASAGLSPADVKIKWVPDLLKLNDKSWSPAMAFHDDPSVDAAFVISPDAAALTSNGKVGTGSEDSVKGATILLSSRTANRVIADVYAVRADYFQAHRAEVERLTSGLLLAEEQLRSLMKSETGDAYKQMISAAAELLMDSKDMTSETAGMYGDAELAGYRGNVKFFGDPNNPRGFDKLVPEVELQLISLGLLSRTVPFAQAKWDYAALAVDLTDTANVELPRFDSEAVQQLVERRAKQGEKKEGVLIEFEIYFGPNQNAFPAEQYQASFDKAIQLATTYGGGLITIEGHSDPLGYLKLKKEGNPPMVLSQARQAAKNLSYSRANAVKDSVIAFAKGKGITLDPSQFGIAGYGVSQPNTPSCRMEVDGDISLACAPATKQEWDASRRVVFKIINVEAETAVFKPL